VSGRASERERKEGDWDAQLCSVPISQGGSEKEAAGGKSRCGSKMSVFFFFFFFFLGFVGVLRCAVYKKGGFNKRVLWSIGKYISPLVELLWSLFIKRMLFGSLFIFISSFRARIF
jgi:hypothetical protein